MAYHPQCIHSSKQHVRIEMTMITADLSQWVLVVYTTRVCYGWTLVWEQRDMAVTQTALRLKTSRSPFPVLQ